MSRFASPHRHRYEPKPRQSRKKNDSDWSSETFSQHGGLSELPLPPPPPDSYYSDSQSTMSSSTNGTKRAKSPSWFDQRNPKPLLRGRSVLLANQLISALNVDREGPNSPSTVLFPSRNIESSSIVRGTREDISDMKAQWSTYAAETIKHVQSVSSMIAHCRQQREMLNQKLVETEFQALTKTQELEDLYNHLEALERVAEQRGVRWVRPPLIKSNAKMVSPRNIALSVESTAVNMGSQSTGWRVALRNLISPANPAVTLDDEAKMGLSETKVRLENRGSAIAMRDRMSSLLDPEEGSHDEKANELTKKADVSANGHREAPRAPLGRPGGLVHQEIQRVSPTKHLDNASPLPSSHRKQSAKVERKVKRSEDPVSASFLNGRVLGNSTRDAWESFVEVGDQNDDEEEEEIEFTRVSRGKIPMNKWVTCPSNGSSRQIDLSGVEDDVRVLSAGSHSVQWKAERVTLTSAMPPPPPTSPPPTSSQQTTPYSRAPRGGAAPATSSVESARDVMAGQITPLTSSVSTASPAILTSSTKANQRKVTPEVPVQVQRSLFSANLSPPPPPVTAASTVSSGNSAPVDTIWSSQPPLLPTLVEEVRNEESKIPYVAPQRSAPKPPLKLRSAPPVPSTHLLDVSNGRVEEKRSDREDRAEVIGELLGLDSGENGMTLEEIAKADQYWELNDRCGEEEIGYGNEDHKMIDEEEDVGWMQGAYPDYRRTVEIDDQEEEEFGRFRFIARGGGEEGDGDKSNATRELYQQSNSGQSYEVKARGRHDSVDSGTNYEGEFDAEYHEEKGLDDSDRDRSHGDDQYGQDDCYGYDDYEYQHQQHQGEQQDGHYDNPQYDEEYVASQPYDQNMSSEEMKWRADDNHRMISNAVNPASSYGHQNQKQSPVGQSRSLSSRSMRPFQNSAAQMFGSMDENDEREEDEDEEESMFNNLKESVMKNKWCRGTLRRLSMFDTILKALKRVGNCHRFIKHCCPEEYAEEFDLSNRKVLELPVSAVWMESIAIKLGTFWALPERTFLEECLLACDPSGKRHAKWLSLLFLSCHPVLYSKREQLQHSRSFDFSQGSESVEHADSIHESGEENLFDLNGDATTLLPDGFQIGSNKHQFVSSANQIQNKQSQSSPDKPRGRRVSVASAAPQIARQMSREEQLDQVASNIRAERNRFIGDLTKKERRSSMIKAEQGWDTHFAKKKTAPIARTFSGGLEKFDQLEDEALRSSQFESIPMPSHRTRTTDFSAAMGGRGELGTGRNWTGSSGAKGMKQSDREDAIRTSAIMQHLQRETHQLFLAIVKTLRTGSIPIERVQTDLALHFPHGHLDNNDDVRMALKFAGRRDATAGEVSWTVKFLSYVAEHVEVGQVKDEHGKLKRSGTGKNKLMQWRDFILVLKFLYTNYKKIT